MGAQTKDNTLDPRQLAQYLRNEENRRENARENARLNQQRPQEQEVGIVDEVGIGDYERQQQEGAQQQDMDQQRLENTSNRGSGIAFGPGRSKRGDVDIRRLIQDRLPRNY